MLTEIFLISVGVSEAITWSQIHYLGNEFLSIFILATLSSIVSASLMKNCLQRVLAIVLILGLCTVCSIIASIQPSVPLNESAERLHDKLWCVSGLMGCGGGYFLMWRLKGKKLFDEI